MVMGLIREYQQRVVRAIDPKDLDVNGNVGNQKLPELDKSTPSIE